MPSETGRGPRLPCREHVSVPSLSQPLIRRSPERRPPRRRAARGHSARGKEGRGGQAALPPGPPPRAAPAASGGPVPARAASTHTDKWATPTQHRGGRRAKGMCGREPEPAPATHRAPRAHTHGSACCSRDLGGRRPRHQLTDRTRRKSPGHGRPQVTAGLGLESSLQGSAVHVLSPTPPRALTPKMQMFSLHG